MRRHSDVPSSTLGSKLWLAVSASLLMAVEWIILVGGTRPHEMLVGAACILLSTLFLASVYKTSTLKLEFHISDIAQGLRIPWYVFSDCFTVSRVLLRDLFTARHAASLYRVSEFRTSKDNPRLVARSVLATVYTTTSPNSIVIGIDYQQSRLLFHQLERSAVSDMTRNLGANS
jgi:hypothetical protein